MKDSDQRIKECIEMAREMIAAESGLLEILTANPSADETALACGKVHEIANEHQIAEGFYREALRHSPDRLEALARLALVLLKRGDFTEGLAVARQLEEADPVFVFETITGRCASAMTVLGDALCYNGELGRAKIAYQASVELTGGKDRHSLGHLAEELLREGHTDEAVEVLQQHVAPDELQGLSAFVALLRIDRNGLTSFRPILDRSVVGSLGEVPI